MFSLLKELGIDTESMIGEWICNICQSKSNIIGFCEPCEKKKAEDEMLLNTKKLYLAQIDKEFAEKFGLDFGLNSFKTENKYQEDIIAGIRKYISLIKDMDYKNAKGIIFYGNQGNGKSMLSNIIQFEALKRGKKCKRVSQYKLYNDLLDQDMRNDNDYNYFYPEFLFLDELGRINNTDHAQRTFFDLINRRYTQNKQTIITTNLKRTELDKFIDPDRLKSYWIVRFDWQSKRENIGDMR